MSELRPGNGAEALDETRDARQHLDVLVFIDAEVLRRDAAAVFDGNGFGVDETGAADRAAPKVHEVPVVGEAVDRRVLTHR